MEGPYLRTKIYGGKDSFLAEKNPRFRGLVSVENVDEDEWFSVFISQDSVYMSFCPHKLTLVQIKYFTTDTQIVGRLNGEQHTIELIDFPFDRLITHRFALEKDEKIPVWTIHNS